jgi:hypothetical protein
VKIKNLYTCCEQAGVEARTARRNKVLTEWSNVTQNIKEDEKCTKF